MRRFCLQNVESILGDTKRDLSIRAGPSANYVRVIITPQRQPARRLNNVDYQRVTELLQTTGDSLTTHSARFYMLMVTINAFLRQKIPNLEKLLSQEL